MAKNATKTTKTANTEAPGTDIGQGLYMVAKAIEAHGDDSNVRYQVEALADNIAGVSSSFDLLAHATLLRLIAQHGDVDDRSKAVEIAKRYFEEFRNY